MLTSTRLSGENGRGGGGPYKTAQANETYTQTRGETQSGFTCAVHLIQRLFTKTHRPVEICGTKKNSNTGHLKTCGLPAKEIHGNES